LTLVARIREMINVEGGLRGGERDVRKWCRLNVNVEDAVHRLLRRLEFDHFVRTLMS